MSIIDAHVHVHHPEAPLPDHELFPGFEARTEDLVADLDDHGIDGAVLVPMNADRQNVSYASKAVTRYPGRFAAIGIYEPTVDDPVEQYRDLLNEYPLQGLRVSSLDASQGDDPRELEIWPLLETFADLGHCLWMYPQIDQYDVVDAIAAELPDLKVVYNLLGYPHPGGLEHYTRDEDGLPRITRWDMPDDMPDAQLDQLRASGQRPNTYVLFGTHWQYSRESYPYRDLIDHSQAICDAFGPDQMAFITDWPWMREVPGYDRLLELVDIHLPELSTDERAEIMGGTARRLLQF